MVFTITDGSHMGLGATESTDTNGQAHFSWGGDDIGTNLVQVAIDGGTTIQIARKTWVDGTTARYDTDSHGDVDKLNYRNALLSRYQSAGVCDARDADGNGTIAVRDAKICFRRCTRAHCATN